MHSSLLSICGDVATDLLPTMPPECSQNKQGWRRGCDTKSSARLSTSRFQSATKERRSPNFPKPADQPVWVAVLIYLFSFFLLRPMLKDRRAVYTTFGLTSTVQIPNTPHVFSCSRVSAVGAPQLSLLYIDMGKLGGGLEGCCLCFLCSPAAGFWVLFWKHRCWEVGRLRVPNICPSLQHQNIIMQISALFTETLFKWRLCHRLLNI